MLNNVTNGSWIIVSYRAYLQEPNIRMCMEWIEKINHEKDIETSNSLFSIIRHIRLCDFGVSGELVFIYTNTFAGTSVYTSEWACIRVGLGDDGNRYRNGNSADAGVATRDSKPWG
ncbi:hypothetical protein D9758_017286 [Tetrapyrgos nigripes]|uniref:Uncharacterized protein n=1 Tax=Tetrapyrgos nigripes TaxID=182062 RepID=A0A8H5FEX4_9AGAR|nr:hypothetical protein D9758_017286 [Tetrapyrgos nigripes]